MSTLRSNQHLALYTSSRCVFCLYVMRTIHKLGVNVELRDVNRNPEYRRDLVAATGRRTVPVLYIDHGDGQKQWMPESRDIVRYLTDQFGR